MPTGQRGQMLALGLVLLVLGGLYFLAVAPLVDLYQGREAGLENGRMVLPHLQAAAAALPALRAQVAELRAAARTRKVTLDGASDAIASANLQSRIEGFAASVGATIGSTESLPSETADGYRRIGLRFALNGPYETLVKLLAKLEEATPPLDRRQSAGPRRAAAAGVAAGSGWRHRSRRRARRLRIPQRRKASSAGEP